MSPKSLLRHPRVVSDLKELSEGSFQEVLNDPGLKDPKAVETVVLCSGKLFYELEKYRSEKYPDRKDIAIIRVEQLYPFPKAQLTPYLNGFAKLNKIIWAQEEPRNMGAWTFIQPRLTELLDDLGRKKMSVSYVGRPDKASPAVGSAKTHDKEQAAIIEQCFV